jgi:hypothetical protein
VSSATSFNRMQWACCTAFASKRGRTQVCVPQVVGNGLLAFSPSIEQKISASKTSAWRIFAQKTCAQRAAPVVPPSALLFVATSVDSALPIARLSPVAAHRLCIRRVQWQ